MKFSKIMGQEALKRHFKTALRRKQFSQAYIIEGEALSGKKMMAKAFASALLCERGGEEACGICHSCRMVASNGHPDLVYTTHEKPNQYKIDEIREQLVEDSWLRPFYGKYKIYIVDEAEKITLQGQNALLKTLEDPPDYVIIFLLCTNTQQFLPTIRSRCMKLSMAPVSDSLIIDRLTKELRIPEYEARTLCAFARGNLGKAFSLSSNQQFSDMKKKALDLLIHLEERPIANLFTDAENLEEICRDKMSELFDFFVLWYRDIIVFKATNDKFLLVFLEDEIEYAISQASKRLTYAKINENIHCIAQARKHLSENVGAVWVLQQLILELRQETS